MGVGGGVELVLELVLEACGDIKAFWFYEESEILIEYAWLNHAME